MKKRQIAVLDIGSSKVSAVVGEKGINDTFILKFNSKYDYEGYASGEFYELSEFTFILKKIAKELKDFFRGKPDEIYIGVPADFTNVYVRDSQISFFKKKKIIDKDIESLFEKSFDIKSDSYKLINRSAVLYELDDFRRVANPIGISSEILKAKLSFIMCKKYFIRAVEPIFRNAGFNKIEFVSTSLAEAIYLIEPDTRDRLAILLDVGYISSSLSVIHGDGIVYQKSFDYGGGYINAELIKDFNVSFEEAEKIKRRLNLTRYVTQEEEIDILDSGRGQAYNISKLKESVFNSLDCLCENIANAFGEFKTVIPEYVTLMITGGGISYLRGAKEHVAGRLNMSVQIIEPQVPLMQKPTMSSILSLLNLALEQ